MEYRFGWYLQQFIKLSAVKMFADYKEIVIWDADTVPLKQIRFFNNSGEPIHFVGTEHHKPYFSAIEKLLGMKKIVGYSFITQNFPITGEIVEDFFEHIEMRNRTSWFDAVLESAIVSESSGFSEYETLGTFIANQYPNLPNVTLTPWIRNGYNEAGTADISIAIERLREQRYAYAAFEDFHQPDRRYHVTNICRKSKRILKRGLRALKKKRLSTRWVGNPLMAERFSMNFSNLMARSILYKLEQMMESIPTHSETISRRRGITRQPWLSR
jgi:hypothetical protein